MRYALYVWQRRYIAMRDHTLRCPALPYVAMHESSRRKLAISCHTSTRRGPLALAWQWRAKHAHSLACAGVLAHFLGMGCLDIVKQAHDPIERE